MSRKRKSSRTAPAVGKRAKGARDSRPRNRIVSGKRRKSPAPTKKSTPNGTVVSSAVAPALGQGFPDSEVVIGLVGAVGTDLNKVIKILEDRLKAYEYKVETIQISRDIIPSFASDSGDEPKNEYERISQSMDVGNRARLASGDNSILALGAASWIASLREKDAGQSPKPLPRRAFLIKSLKHPDEVARLREIYPLGFYLLGVYSNDEQRREYLEKDKRIKSSENVGKLIKRDADENLPYGQRVTDTFHLADFFVWGTEDRLKSSIWRVLDALFGHPYCTPTFDEYAMFLAFAASLRSADLSRQVGAVVAVNNEIIATGANDCPRAGGGQYWPVSNEGVMEDEVDGRDYKRGKDPNVHEQNRIIEEIVDMSQEFNLNAERVRKALKKSRIRDITEFGRVVHAEMDALLGCSRNHASTRGATLYCTTFPCHNCAKHIIASGITRVVYIEPYPKSRTAEFHDDSISMGLKKSVQTPPGQRQLVNFEPFVGVGPRKFFDLFSMKLGSGWELKRKDIAGSILPWEPEKAHLRVQMLPTSYLELELKAGELFKETRKKKAVK